MPFDISPEYTTNQTAKTLRDAAAYIEKHGWCQHNLREPDGRVCLEGAIRKGHTGYQLEGQEFAAFVAVGSYVNECPVDFNDAEGRTKEDVIAALHGAADMVERQS